MAVMDGGYHYPKTYDVILFDYVLLNLGEHYDAQTSIFTCAENGLYLFSVTLYSAGEYKWAYIRQADLCLHLYWSGLYLLFSIQVVNINEL